MDNSHIDGGERRADAEGGQGADRAGHGYGCNGVVAVNATTAGTEGGAQSAGAQNPQPPLECGGLGHVDGVARPVQDGQDQFSPDDIACIVRENTKMRIRMGVQAGERARTERIELERLQLGGGMGVRGLQRAQRPGSFLVCLGKSAPKLDSSKAENVLVWKKQFTSWAVTNSCEDALLETTNPIYFRLRTQSAGKS